MSTLNPAVSPGISIGYAVASVADWLRKVTVRINGRRGSHGSGVLWLPEGLIVTNAHVAVSQAHDVELADGRRAQARLMARDPRQDVAALTISLPFLPSASVRSARQ